MQLKTILNRVQKFKSFVYTAIRFVAEAGEQVLEVEVQPRANGRPICSECGRERPGYDRLPARRFEFVPLSKRAYGFRTFRAQEIALYHALGALPEPEFTHRFCRRAKNISEAQYFGFLRELSEINGVVYAVATDAGLNQPAEVAEHQRIQAEKIAEHKEKMLHRPARQGLLDLSAQVAALAPQLYVQLQCQVILIANILLSGVLYFVQRRPKSLGRFRWREGNRGQNTNTANISGICVLTPGYR